jgi:recombination protein RecR
MARYPAELTALISFLKKLPGVGSKTAERFAFQLLNWKEEELSQLGASLATLKEKIHHCSECGCLMDSGYCSFCHTQKRDQHILCIIASAKDAFTLEETHSFQGLYHVLGALLSPMDGRTVERLSLNSLKKRIAERGVKEVIIALDSTLEGDTTALYLKQELSDLGLSVFRLAFGLPIGSSLDFVDGGTLARALTGKQAF